MAFQLFTQKDVRSNSKPRISIMKTGTFHLNAPCMRERFKEVHYAQLFYDAENRLIAVKPATAKDEHAWKVAHSKNRGGNISGIAFLRHHKISYKKTALYAAEWFEELGALVIKLDDSNPMVESDDDKPNNQS